MNQVQHPRFAKARAKQQQHGHPAGQPRRLRQKGYSLIELSIALAIISVLIVGSLIGVQRILNNNRANSVLSEIPRINAALVGAVANSGSFDTLNTSKAASLGAFSPSSVTWAADKASVSNAFGGQLFVQGNKAAFDGVTRGYVVATTGIPADMCATVINGLAPLAQALWVDQLKDAADFDKPLESAPKDDELIKGPAQNSAVNLDKLVSKCRGNNATAQTIHAFVAI